MKKIIAFIAAIGFIFTLGTGNISALTVSNPYTDFPAELPSIPPGR